MLDGKKITRMAILALDAYVLIKQVKRISTDIKIISEPESRCRNLR